MGELAGISKSYRAKLSKVLARHSKLMSAALVAEVLGISTKEANGILARWNNAGWIERVKRGLYTPASIETGVSTYILEEPFLIAASIYGPGYIGGFSAIKHWDLTEQIIETVYYFTTHKVKDRQPKHGGIQFKLKTVTPERIFGVKPVWIGGKKIDISDPAKTVVDILNDPKLVGGMTIVYDVFLEYCESKYCDFPKLLEYCHKMGNKTIFKRLGFMVETKMDNPPAELTGLEKHISTGHSDFDPLVKSKHIIEKWKLRAPPSWIEEHDRKK